MISDDRNMHMKHLYPEKVGEYLSVLELRD